MANPGRDKQERLARVYDAEVWPLWGQRVAQGMLRLVTVRPGASVLEVGAATGGLTLELIRRFDEDSRFTAADSAAMVAAAGVKLTAAGVARSRVTWLANGDANALPGPEGAFDVALFTPSLGDDAVTASTVAGLARTLRPGGQLIFGLPLRGCWGEFLDIYRDALEENGRGDGLAALEQYVAAMPDGETAAAWAEAAGLRDVELLVQRWELLFKSAREFFFAPAIELGPLSRWKAMAGRGEEMQDIFFFVKEAIDAYFSGGVFAVTVVAGCVKGWRR